MNVSQAKSIPLEEILGKYGHVAVHRRGTDIWYRSPFRAEETPSFVVNARKNVWYDHGEGRGGTVIDIVSRLSGETSIASVLKLVSDLVGGSVAVVSREVVIGKGREGERVLPVGDAELSHPALVKYLQGRAIPSEFASRYVREVRYRVGEKNYFGIGFKNESGGYEVRNPYFKGCIGAKDISVVPAENSGIINVFEGFMDFLSWPLLSGEGYQRETALVLNSVSLVSRAVSYFQTHPFEEIRLFLDRDEAGRTAERHLREALPSCRIVDMSDRYRESEDVNRELVRVENRKTELENTMRKGK